MALIQLAAGMRTPSVVRAPHSTRIRATTHIMCMEAPDQGAPLTDTEKTAKEVKLVNYQVADLTFAASLSAQVSGRWSAFFARSCLRCFGSPHRDSVVAPSIN